MYRVLIISFLSLLFVSGKASSQSQSQWLDSLKVLNDSIEKSPLSLDLRLNKAAVCLQLLDWDAALKECNTVLQADTNNLAALFYRAYANNSLHRYPLAKNDYEGFLRKSPRNLEARLGLAYTLVNLHKETEALDKMNILVEMFPDSSIVYAARADIEKGQKSYEAALYDSDMALNLSPDNRDYLVAKVDILILLGRRSDAKEVLDDAVRKGVPRGLLREWYLKCK